MRYLVSLAFLTASGTSFAEDLETRSKTVYCKPESELVAELTQEHGEQPIWAGDDTQGQSKYALSYNPIAKTWTFIQSDGATACILGYGLNAQKSRI